MCDVTLQAFDRSSFGVGGGVSSNRFMPSDRVGDPVPSRAPRLDRTETGTPASTTGPPSPQDQVGDWNLIMIPTIK